MNLLDLAKTVGTAALSVAAPGVAPMAIAAINALLPNEHKLPADATGNQIKNRIETLSADQKAALLAKQYDVEMTCLREGNETLRAMFHAEKDSRHSTRPHIAKGCFYVLAAQTLLVSGGLTYAIVTSDEAMVSVIGDAAVLLIGMTATFAYVLKAYFGILSKESQDRQNAINGFENAGAITSLMKGLRR